MRNVCYAVLFLAITFACSVSAVEGISVRAVPTFECCSIYVKGMKIAPSALKVRYRKLGAPQWQNAHQLVNTDDYPVARGSLFNLQPGTDYEVEVAGGGGDIVGRVEFRTWSDDVTISKTVKISEANPTGGPFLIDRGGSAGGWVRYVGDGKSVIDGGTADIEALLIENCGYVILENLIIRGGMRHGIRLKNCNNIRIINCDIAGFGRVGTHRTDLDGKYYDKAGKAINYDAGIYVDLAQDVVIEKNYIHDPRNHANSWYYSHPAGPTAVYMRARGGIVLRYNDFVGSVQHRWNDVIEGHGNGKPDGGFNRDSDIYGNYLVIGNDDGIELDGGQCNVRFWGNKIENTLCGISTAANLRGPSYIFNNLVANLGDERGVAGSCVKNGGGTTYSKGRSYFYNNTFFSNGKGIAAVGYGRDNNRGEYLATSRNNILAVTSYGISNRNDLKGCDFDYDYFTTPYGTAGIYSLPAGFEKHGIKGKLPFVDALRGDFALQENSAAISGGVAVTGLSAATHMGCVRPGESALMPKRNGMIIPQVAQMVFSVTGKGDDVLSQNLNVAFAGFTGSKHCRILKNDAFDWLEVTPADAQIKSGDSVDLKVRVLEQHIKDGGLIPGAFIIKLDSGESFPVSVFVKARSRGLNMSFNAAECEGADQFKVIAGSDSKPQHVEFFADTPRVVGKKSLKIKVNAPASGRYDIAALIKCPEPAGNHDSVFLSVNGSKLKMTGIMAGNFWHWAPLGGKVELRKGENVIEIMPREDIYLSRIKIGAQAVLTGEKP